MTNRDEQIKELVEEAWGYMSAFVPTSGHNPLNWVNECFRKILTLLKEQPKTMTANKNEQIKELLEKARVMFVEDGHYEACPSQRTDDKCPVCLIDQALALLKEQPCDWIPVSEGLPKLWQYFLAYNLKYNPPFSIKVITYKDEHKGEYTHWKTIVLPKRFYTMLKPCPKYKGKKVQCPTCGEEYIVTDKVHSCYLTKE